MIQKEYSKLVDAGRLTQEIVTAGLPLDPTPGFVFYGITTTHSTDGDTAYVLCIDGLTQQQSDTIDTVVAAHIPTPLPPTPPDPVPVHIEGVVLDDAGKLFVRAESRPLNCTTYFTTAGDKITDPVAIGDGPRLEWDAADDEYPWVIDSNLPGIKRLTVDIQFIDSVWVKEGTVYWMSAAKDNYLDMYIVCPNGGYYMYMGEIKQNTTGTDLVVEHYVNKHPVQGDCPMGDEMNTETCSQEMPSYMKIRMIMTTPVDDMTSHGYVELEMFRRRTVILG